MTATRSQSRRSTARNSRRSLPRVLTDAEQERFLAAFNTRYWTPARDRTLCLTMLDAGLRVAEACALKLDHLDLAARRLTVRSGKGGRDRRVPIVPRLATALEKWLERRGEAGEAVRQSPYVFPTRSGAPVHPNQVRRTVTRAVERARLREPGKISPHTLRHTFATDVLNATGNLELVRRLLGHASISTTQVYTHLADADLEAALRLNGFRT